MMTMHGTTMIFFAAMPILAGVANYIVPLQIGARDMAFPRLNALGLWVTLFGGMLCYFSFATGGAPAIGWFAYAPLTEHAFSRRAGDRLLDLRPACQRHRQSVRCDQPGHNGAEPALSRHDLAQDSALHLDGVLGQRADYFALPPLTAALVMLLFDRKLGAHFFECRRAARRTCGSICSGSSAIPEVYILVLPAFGMVSDVIPVFSRKVIFGYEFVAASTVAIAFVSFGVWAHHMFTVGMSRTSMSTSPRRAWCVGIPTGVKIFNWLATVYGGRWRMAAPMLFCLRLPVDVRHRRTDGHHARRGSGGLSAHRTPTSSWATSTG